MKKDLILVFGATGTVGTELVKILKSQGLAVRSTTSKRPSTPDTVQVNLANGEGVASAFEGVDRAFLLSPPGFADQYQVLSPLIKEAKRRGLKKVVLMSAMGANAVESAPLRRAELELENSGLNYNIIRPNWFFQNFATFWVQAIKEQAKILLPVGRAKTSFIDAADISAVAAKLLVNDELNNRAFDITGAESLDHDEIAREISAVTGKAIQYQEIEPSVLREGLLAAGLSKDYVEFLLMILGFLREGHNERRTDNVQLILGRAPRSFKQYAQAAKEAWM